MVRLTAQQLGALDVSFFDVGITYSVVKWHGVRVDVRDGGAAGLFLRAMHGH